MVNGSDRPTSGRKNRGFRWSPSVHSLCKTQSSPVWKTRGTSSPERTEGTADDYTVATVIREPLPTRTRSPALVWCDTVSYSVTADRLRVGPRAEIDPRNLGDSAKSGDLRTVRTVRPAKSLSQNHHGHAGRPAGLSCRQVLGPALREVQSIEPAGGRMVLPRVLLRLAANQTHRGGSGVSITLADVALRQDRQTSASRQTDPAADAKHAVRQNPRKTKGRRDFRGGPDSTSLASPRTARFAGTPAQASTGPELAAGPVPTSSPRRPASAPPAWARPARPPPPS